MQKITNNQQTKKHSLITILISGFVPDTVANYYMATRRSHAETEDLRIEYKKSSKTSKTTTLSTKCLDIFSTSSSEDDTTATKYQRVSVSVCQQMEKHDNL